MAERIVVVGAGAIGGVVGSALARAGRDVVLVDVDPEHVEAIRTRGLRISGVEAHTVQVPCVFPEELQGTFDLIALAVRGQDTDAALVRAVPHLSAGGCVLSLQNGLQVDKIAHRVGPQRTIGSFLTFSAHFEDPGHIEYAGPGCFRIGELDGALTPRIRHLAELCADVHPVEVTDNIRGWIWSKLCLSCLHGAMALADADVLDILARADCLELLSATATEVLGVADAEQVTCEVIDGFDLNLLRTPARLTDQAWGAEREYWHHHLGQRTGYWYDLAVRHRPTEVDASVGAVLSRGRGLSVPMPICQRLYDAIKVVERGQAPLGWATFYSLKS